MVRQLSAELHIDTSMELVRALHPFLSKLHYIYADDAESGSQEEAEALAKSTNGKAILFKSPSAYVSKLFKPSAPAPSQPSPEFVKPAVQMQPQGSS